MISKVVFLLAASVATKAFSVKRSTEFKEAISSTLLAVAEICVNFPIAKETFETFFTFIAEVGTEKAYIAAQESSGNQREQLQVFLTTLKNDEDSIPENFRKEFLIAIFFIQDLILRESQLIDEAINRYSNANEFLKTSRITKNAIEGTLYMMKKHGSIYEQKSVENAIRTVNLNPEKFGSAIARAVAKGTYYRNSFFDLLKAVKREVSGLHKS